MSLHKKNESLFPKSKKGNSITSRQEAINIVTEIIKDTFETDDGFDNDYDIPIAWNCSFFDSEILIEKLKKAVNKESLIINDCDSVNDIINNNFRF